MMHNDSIHVHSNSSGKNIPGHAAHSSIGKCNIGGMAFVVCGSDRLRVGLESNLQYIFISEIN